MATTVYVRPVGVDDGYRHTLDEDISTEEIMERALADGFLFIPKSSGAVRAYPISSIAFIDASPKKPK